MTEIQYTHIDIVQALRIQHCYLTIEQNKRAGQKVQRTKRACAYRTTIVRCNVQGSKFTVTILHPSLTKSECRTEQVVDVNEMDIDEGV